MKTTYVSIILFCFGSIAFAQKKIPAPKTVTNIESVDSFVQSAFNIYNTVFDFHYGGSTEITYVNDSEDKIEETLLEDGETIETLDESTIEIEEGEETNKDEFEIIENNIKRMIEEFPSILEVIEKESTAKQIKATLNLNKAIKVLRRSGKIIKMTIKGE